jgi:hypothetical protein
MKDKLAFFNNRLKITFGRYLYNANEKKKEVARKRLEELLKAEELIKNGEST